MGHDHEDDNNHHSHADHSHGHSHFHPHESGATVHAHRAASKQSVRAYVITASDSRTDENDTSGRYLREALLDRGHTIVGKEIVRDETALVRMAVERAAAAAAEVVLITGGTGITPRDSTYEAVQGLFAKELPGFGELFRFLSFQEIGSAAMLSRATAGVTSEGLVIVALPGSTSACRTAMEKLLGPELPHLVREATLGATQTPRVLVPG